MRRRLSWFFEGSTSRARPGHSGRSAAAPGGCLHVSQVRETSDLNTSEETPVESVATPTLWFTTIGAVGEAASLLVEPVV